MGKKGQLTLLIILGVFILIVLIFIIFLSSRSAKQAIQTETKKPINLMNAKTQAENYLTECVNELTLSINRNSGVKIGESTLSEYRFYLIGNLDKCDLNNIKETLGADEIITDYSTSEVTVEPDSDNNILVKITLPVTLKKGDSEIKFSEFSSKFVINSFFDLPVDNTGKFTQSFKARLSDGALLSFEKDTVMTPASTWIKLSAIDLRFGFTLDNNIIIGNRVYEVLPKGTTFSKNVKIEIPYDKQDVPGSYTPKASQYGALNWNSIDSGSCRPDTVCGSFKDTNGNLFAATLDASLIPTSDQYMYICNVLTCNVGNAIGYYDYTNGIFVPQLIFYELKASYPASEIKPLTRSIFSESDGTNFQLFSFRDSSKEDVVMVHIDSTGTSKVLTLTREADGTYTDRLNNLVFSENEAGIHYAPELFCSMIHIDNSLHENLITVFEPPLSFLDYYIQVPQIIRDSNGNIYPVPSDGHYQLYGPSQLHSGSTLSFDCLEGYHKRNIPKFKIVS